MTTNTREAFHRTNVAGRFLARSSFSVLLALPVFTASAPFLATSASAEFRVCNDSSETVGVAVGYRSEEGWVSEGWWHVNGDSCEVLLPGTLSSRYMYLYAENAERSQRWGGSVPMCTADEEFRIVGVEDCIARSYTRVGFGEYDTGEEPAWTVRLKADDTQGAAVASETQTAPLSQTN